MSLLRQIILGVAVLSYGGFARADLHLDSTFPSSQPILDSVDSVDSAESLKSTNLQVADPQMVVSPAQGLLLTGTALGGIEWSANVLESEDGLLDSLFDGSVGQSDAPVLREIRPLPSSAALFFTAMLSLGGLHVFRHPPSLHLSALPNWYHTGGPAQVGHATPFDFDFGSLVVAAFDEPGVEPTFCIDARRELRTRCVDQHFLVIADPRGPPIQPATLV